MNLKTMQWKFSIFIVAAAAFSVASAVPVEGQQKFIEIVGDDGQVLREDLTVVPNMDLLADIARNPANNRYFLYTRQNPDTPKELVHHHPETIWNSGYEGWKTTVIIAHGWYGDQDDNFNSALKDAFLEKSDVNVIVLDWSRLASSNYVTAATGTAAVGRGLGQFIQWLHWNTGAAYYNFHLIGFSLGAHLVGNAGRHLQGSLSRITGLDPAGLLWQYNSERLSASDANYVEVIHTGGGLTGLGISTDLGHVDFYPNGGNSMPGCLTNRCDHNRAWEYFAATITHDHLIGNECSTNLQMTLNRCSGRTLNMGNGDPYKRGSGVYRVNTARRYPF